MGTSGKTNSRNSFSSMNLANRQRWDEFFSTEKIAILKPDAWLERWAPLLSEIDGDILDLGCGDGSNYDALEQYCPSGRICGVDQSSDGIARARALHPGADFQELDFSEELPYAADSFAMVFADLSLHYLLAAQRSRVLGEIKRILKPGGVLLGRVNAVGDREHTEETGELEKDAYLQSDGTVKNTFDRETWAEILEQHFGDVMVTENTSLKYTAPKQLLEFSARKN
jgi:SAM-dependent methyltransferase